MDGNKLAELIFPNIRGTIAQLEERFPKRELPEGAYVTRFAPSPTGYMHIGPSTRRSRWAQPLRTTI